MFFYFLLKVTIVINYELAINYPFSPHINQNNNGSFTYGNITYSEYTKEDFMDKFIQLEIGKK